MEDIRRRVAAGEAQKILAIDYNISQPYVCQLVNGQRKSPHPLYGHLTPEQVAAIKALKPITQVEVAKRYNVSPTMICRIMREDS